MSDLLTRYDAALLREYRARIEYEGARHEREELGAHIQRALDLADEAPVPRNAAQVDAGADAGTKPVPGADDEESDDPRVIASIREVVLKLPAFGDVDLDEAAALTDLKRINVANRLSRAKRLGLVETGGRGSFRLTEKGRAYKAAQASSTSGGSRSPPSLRVVEPNDDPPIHGEVANS